MTNKKMKFTNIPKAVGQGVLQIAGLEIETVVLDDGRRLVTEEGLEALLSFLTQVDLE